MKELIQANNLYFEYNHNDDENDPVPALYDITMSVSEGEFVAILGHNGSGKSTLAKHFNAILTPTTGTLFVDGIDASDEELVFDIRSKVGMVFQNPDNQIVATVVEEDVAFGLENLGVSPKNIRKKVDESLEIVDMYKFKEHAPHQLSGGQKQRVAIAGIIAMRPKCIVLDEPTAMLDPKGRSEVMKTMKTLNKEYNTTVILITHFMEEAVLADRVIVIDNGNKVADDVPKKVFCNVDELKSMGLDVPQVTEFTHLLIQENIKLSNDILTIDECVEEIEKLLEAKN